MLAHNPLREVVSDPSRYLVNFLSEIPDREEVAALLAEDHSPESIAIEGSEAYVWTPDGVRGMTLSHAYLQKRLDVDATARNMEYPQQDRRQVLIRLVRDALAPARIAL